MNSAETVVKIPIARLRPFPNHPFYVRDDEMMLQLVESMRNGWFDELNIVYIIYQISEIQEDLVFPRRRPPIT